MKHIITESDVKETALGRFKELPRASELKAVLPIEIEYGEIRCVLEEHAKEENEIRRDM